MDNGKCILRVHKKIVLAFFVLSCGMLLTGCEMVNILAYKAAEKVANGEMFAKADCTVLSVEGSIGSSHYICENSTDTYVYDKENICNYNTGEMLVELDHDLLYMACNDDVLYYATDRYDESFYCYNFQTGEKQLVQDGYEVTGMQAYEDDVFVVLRELDTQSDYSEDYKEKNEVWYFHKDEEPVSLTQWVSENEPHNIMTDYKSYIYEGYQIWVDDSLQEYNPRIVYIEKDEEFHYSCCGRALNDRASDTYNWMEGDIIRLTADGKCRYHGTEEKLEGIIQEDVGEDYTGLSTSIISFRGGTIGIIEQYARGAFGYEENPDTHYKNYDAFYEYVLDTGKCQMLYKVEKKEQIAGYSYTKDCLYIQEGQSVYEYHLDTQEKECIYTSDKEYEGFCYEFMDGKLYIFQRSYTIEDVQEELLSVVE